MVLFATPVHDQVTATGTSERTVYRYLERFTTHGIRGLHPHEPPPHMLSPHLRQLIVTLTAAHPPLRIRDLQMICYMCMVRRLDAKTIKRVLSTILFSLCMQRRISTASCYSWPHRSSPRRHSLAYAGVDHDQHEYLQSHVQTV